MLPLPASEPVRKDEHQPEPDSPAICIDLDDLEYFRPFIPTILC